jgi:hypothetical protein
MGRNRDNVNQIPLIPNTKRPRDKGWQEDTYVGTDFTNQIGLAHKYSGTCSVDLDDFTKCVEIFKVCQCRDGLMGVLHLVRIARQMSYTLTQVLYSHQLLSSLFVAVCLV